MAAGKNEGNPTCCSERNFFASMDKASETVQCLSSCCLAALQAYCVSDWLGA